MQRYENKNEKNVNILINVFFYLFLQRFWRDAGVVDRGGLENRCTLTGTQGSNPCLSAYCLSLIIPKRDIFFDFFEEDRGIFKYNAYFCRL